MVGGLVTKGEFKRGGQAVIRRGDEVLGNATIIGLQQGPEKVESVPKNQECGVLIGTKLQLEADDLIDHVALAPAGPP